MNKHVQLFPSGISLVDSAWGGLYKGGTYLLVGERKTGKTLLSLQFAVECAKQKEVCLFFTNSRPKDLMIQAASIDVDLEDYMNQNLIIVVRVASPPEINDSGDRDVFLSEYLSDIITVVQQYNPSRIVFDEITPYVGYDDVNLLRETFSDTFENIEDLGITSLLILREPASPTSRLIYNILNSYSTGVIKLIKKSDEFDSPKTGVIDIQPNVGHTEGRFKAGYIIEPYKGITTEAKTEKKVTKEFLADNIPETSGKYIPLSQVDLPVVDLSVPNVYSLEDFKLILNNQIAMYKTTGQVFTVLSLKLSESNNGNSVINLNQLLNAVRLAAEKKYKICLIDGKIVVLLPRENEKVITGFISRIKSNLPAIEDLFPKNITNRVLFFFYKMNNSINNAEELLEILDSEHQDKFDHRTS